MIYLVGMIANDLTHMYDLCLVCSNSHSFEHTNAIDRYIPNRHQPKHGERLVVLVWNTQRTPVLMQRNLFQYMNLKIIRFQQDWLNK
jgi:hypothetical protein